MDHVRLARLALAAMLLAAVPGARAQTEEKRQELIRIQKEYEKTKAEIETYRRQGEALSRDLHKIESHDAQTRRRINTIEKNIHWAEDRRRQLKSRLGALNLASGFWTAALDSELRDYAVSLAGREAAWGGADLWTEAFRRAVLLDKARMIASLRGYRIRTEVAAEAARHQTVELADRSRQAQAEARSVREEYERKQAAVAEARQKAEAAAKRVQELEETKLALTRLLARIGTAGRLSVQGGARLEMPRNSLPWPVAGTVARPFGRERNSELNTWVIHQGVTFATRPGAAVGAVGAGQVIYAGTFRSYGKVVIVDHGGGFFSIYGELGEILKPKGATVETGEAVGLAGVAGGRETRGVVYLELRRGTEALDPMAWLEKRM